jgi:hypothetical protein
MTQPPVRHEPRRPPGIPIWVWILVLIVVIAALWWILAADRRATTDDEPLAAPPAVVEEPAIDADYGAGEPLTTGTGFELGTEPIEEPQPPPP